MKSPGRMLCNGCYVDLGPDRFDEDSKTWVYVCPDCPGVDGPTTLEVHEGGAKAERRSGTGVMAELGVYDGIIEALRASAGRWVEFAVMEHLYAQADHTAYETLVERYGHVAIAPDTNTASWMLGRAAWTLSRDQEVLTRRLPRGTGRWSYLSPCHAWALPGTSADAELVTWESFAIAEGFHPRSHPAIDWRDTPNATP